MSKTALSRCAWAVSVALVLALLPVFTGAAQPVTVVGHVIDAGDQTPVSRATLHLAASGSPSKNVLASDTTKRDGRFELPAIDINGILTVEARGYATQRLRWPSAASGGTAT